MKEESNHERADSGSSDAGGEGGAVRHLLPQRRQSHHPLLRDRLYFRCLRMKADAFALATSTSLLSPPARPWPAPLTVTNSCTILSRASSFAIAADCSYGTSVSSVPWISSVGG